MHAVQLLFRQSLHGSLAAVKSSFQRSVISTSRPRNLCQPTLRNNPICFRCQVRIQLRKYSSGPRNDESTSTSQLNAELRSSSSTTSENSNSMINDASANAKSPPPSSQKIESDSRDSHELRATLEEDSLPSQMEKRRSQLSKKFTDLMDNIQGNVFIAGQKLNDLTGYSGIEKLKKEIETQEIQVLEGRNLVRQAKEAYSAAINRRSASQREVNELLQRKHAWSSADLERFTSLYRSDHANELAEIEAQESLTKAENELEETTARLNRSILSRYHEEQIWSDKIRRMSTWGTWGLMGVNVLLFLIFQILVEPWRRRRLVKGFEEKVKEAIETEAIASRTVVAGLTRAVEAGAAPAADVAVEVAPDADTDADAAAAAAEMAVAEVVLDDTAPNTDSAEITVADPGDITPVAADAAAKETFAARVSTYLSIDYWRQFMADILSDRRVVLTQRELTTIALQSATIGASIIGLTIMFCRPN